MPEPRESNILIVMGTRPEAIKLMPVVRALEAVGVQPTLLSTGQHQELLQPFLRELNLDVTEDLGTMRGGQSLSELAARLLGALQATLHRHRPSSLVVQGDTTTVAMSALAAFYQGVRILHVEAGLRTHSRRNPFPEEMNRQLVGRLADVHFAPTPRARENLLAEGIEPNRVHVVGNTVVDAVFYARDHLVGRYPAEGLLARLLTSSKRIVLVTAHRRESFGVDLQAIADGVRLVAERFHDSVEIVYPVHLNPNVEKPMRSRLSGLANVHLLKPLPYAQFVQLLLRAHVILTDSGGVQEEACALGIPFLVARRTSERMEAIEAGVGQRVDPSSDAVFEAITRLLEDRELHAQRSIPSDAFGDGQAGRRIADVITSMS